MTHRIIHDEGCDFANEVVGQENRSVLVVDAKGIVPDRAPYCACGANPELAETPTP